MSKVSELFGIPCDGDGESGREALSKAVSAQKCPYTGNKCYKIRKSNPEIAIGTCTVRHQDKNIIICPSRLLENNQIFLDCLHLLALHEPGNELYTIPEVSVPGGNVDFFLVSARNGKVRDFAGIEIQTLDTTGTVWPERQRLLRNYRLVKDNTDDTELRDARSFGINWKMTAKTILMQLHHKAETFENLDRHIVLVIQSPLLDYMRGSFSFSHIQGVRNGDSVHIHAYGLEEKPEKFRLSLRSRISTDSAGIAKCLGLNASPRIELAQLTALLESKLCEQYRLKMRL